MEKPVAAAAIAADVFGGMVTADTIRRYARQGLIPAVRVNQRGPILFFPAEVLAALRTLRGGTPRTVSSVDATDSDPTNTSTRI